MLCQGLDLLIHLVPEVRELDICPRKQAAGLGMGRVGEAAEATVEHLLGSACQGLSEEQEEQPPLP